MKGTGAPARTTIRAAIEIRIFFAVGAPILAILAIQSSVGRPGVERLTGIGAGLAFLVLGELWSFRARVTVDRARQMVEVVMPVVHRRVPMGDIKEICGPFWGNSSLVLRDDVKSPSSWHRGILLPLQGRDRGISELAVLLDVPVVGKFPR